MVGGDTHTSFGNISGSVVVGHSNGNVFATINNTPEDQRTKRDRIQSWIYSSNPYDAHDGVRQRLGGRYLNSGRWLLEDRPAFGAWKSSIDGVLLLQGIMGSGKSSLTSIVIEHIRGDGPLAFVYCSGDEDTLTILRCLLSQIATLSDGSISPSIVAAYNQGDTQAARGFIRTEEGVVTLLQTLLEERHGENMTFVIDALDECSNYSGLLRQLEKLKHFHSKIRWLFSARVGVKIETCFPVHQTVNVAQGNTGDIRSYVESEVTKRREAVGMTEPQSRRLRDALLRLAWGMFRWVELEISIHLPSPTSQGQRLMPKDIESRLCQLETCQAEGDDLLMGAYSIIYSRALGSKHQESRKRAVSSAVRWVLCSLSPLSPQALLCAVTVEHGGLSAEDFSEETLLEYCSNLLIKDARGKVQLAHLSVRQFFEQKHRRDFEPTFSHRQAALTSLWVLYLVRCSRKRDPCLELPSQCSWISKCELVEYCRTYWAVHYRVCQKDLDLENALAKLKDKLDEPFTGYLCWAGALESFRPKLPRTLLTPPSTIPFSLGCRRTSASWLDDQMLSVFKPAPLCNWFVDTYYQRTGSARHTSSMCVEGKELTVSDTDSGGNTPLHYAAYFNQNILATELLRDGADLHSRNLGGDTPLHVAAASGASETFLELLQAGAITDVLNERGRTALQEVQSAKLAECLRIQSADLRIQSANVENQTRNSRSMLRFPASDPDLKLPEPTRLPLPAAHWNGDTKQSNTRHRPVVYVQRSKRCRVCDFATWIESSCEGKSHTIGWSTFRAAAHKSRCKLCIAVLRRLDRTVSEQSPWILSPILTIEVRLDVDERFKSGRDTLLYNLEMGGTAEFEICIETHDRDRSSADLTRIFCGQAILEDAANSINQWMSRCRSHSSCQTEFSSPAVPTRLLDLNLGEGTQDVRVRLASKITGKHTGKCPIYAWFSWSSDEQADCPMLLRCNLDQMENCIEYNTLPKLWRQVIDVCRACGYQYLFIDELCVVQDNASRKRKATSSGKYITNADLVIVCSPGRRLDDPLLPTNSPSCHVLPANIVIEGEVVLFDIHLREPLERPYQFISDRVLAQSWQQQDVLLPRRAIIFDKDQIYWSCGSGVTSQGNFDLSPPVPIYDQFDQYVSTKFALSAAPFYTIPAFKCLYRKRLELHTEAESTIFAMRFWYSLVETSSKGRLNSTKDRIPAISAIAVEFSRSFTQDELVAGLWRKDFCNGLLWIVGPADIATSPYPCTPDLCSGYVASALWMGSFFGAGAFDLLLSVFGVAPSSEWTHHFDGRLPLREGPITPTWTWASAGYPVSYALIPGLQSASPRDISKSCFEVHLDYPTPRDTVLDIMAVPLSFSFTCLALPVSSLYGERYSAEFECFADVPISMAAFQSLLSPIKYFAIVAPWVFNTRGEARWVGLMIAEKVSGTEEYVRQGVFLGPGCDSDLRKWAKRTFKMV